MTQLPRPESRGLLESLLNEQTMRDDRLAAVRSTISNPFSQPNFNENNNLTFLNQSTGFWGSIGARYNRDASALEALGESKYALMSIPEMVYANMGSENIPAPYLENNSQFVVNGDVKPSSDVRLSEVLDSSPALRATLETYGLDQARLQELRVNTAEDFAEFYPAFTDYIRTQQMLESYNDDHPILAGVAGTTHAVSNIVTDPLLLLGLVFTGGTTSVARETAKQTVKQTLKQTLKRGAINSLRNRIGTVVSGPTGALLNKVTEDQAKRTLMSHLLVTGGASLAGGIYATSGDIAAQDQAIRLGLQDPDLELNYATLGFGMGVGALLGEVTWRIATRSKAISPATSVHRYEESASSLSAARHGRRLEAGERRSTASADWRKEAEEVEADDFVQEMLPNFYAGDTGKKLAAMMDEIGLENFNMRKLARYLATLPTAEELLEQAASGKFYKGNEDVEVPITAYERFTRDIENNYNQVVLFRANGALDEARRVEKRMRKQIKNRDDLVERTYVLRQDDVGTKIRRVLADLPVETAATEAQKQERIQNALRAVMDSKEEGPKSFVSQFTAASRKFGAKWIMPKEQAKGDIGSDNKVRSLIGSMWTVLNNVGFDRYDILRRADGSAVHTADERLREMIDGPVASIQSKVMGLTRNKGYSHTGLYRIVMNYRVYKTPVPEDVKPLVNDLFKFIDDMGKRGLDSRVIDTLFEDFFPVRLNRSAIDDGAAHSAFRRAFVRVYMDRFDPDQVDAIGNPVKSNKIDVNYRALEKSKFLRKNPDEEVGGWVVNNNPLTGRPFLENDDGTPMMPRHLGDLEAFPEVLDVYKRTLRESLDEDAQESFARLKGNSDAENTEGWQGTAPVRRSSMSLNSNRKMLQEVYLDEEVIQSKLLDHDISATVRGYAKTAGYNITRNEAFSELFGERVTWDEVIRTLRSLATDEESSKALDRLILQDQKVAGRFVIDEDFSVAGTILSNVGATLVAGTVVPTIITAELAAGLLRSVVSKGDMQDHIAQLTEAIRKVRDKDTLRRLHIRTESQHLQDRFWADFTDHLPEKARNNLGVRTSRGMALLTRKLFGEQFFTEFGKSLHHSVSYMKLHTNRSKISRIRDVLGDLQSGNLTEAAAARKAGVSQTDFSLMRQFGVLDKDMLDIAEEMMEINPRMLSSDSLFYSNVMKITNPKKRAKAFELHERLSRMASEDANTFIATPTPGDLNVSTNPLKNLLVSMMSFNAAFYGNTLNRVGRGSGWKQAGFFGYIAAAEVSNSVLRDYLYNDKTLEEIQDDWNENTVRNLAMALTRVPITAPLSVPQLAGYALASGRPDLAVSNVGGGAVPKMVANTTKGVFASALSAIDPDREPTPSEIRNAKRAIPGYNNWMLRVIEKLPPLNE